MNSTTKGASYGDRLANKTRRSMKNDCAVLEKDVLKPRDPALTSTDDWPIFSLSKVEVISQSTGNPVSLLTANRKHAVQVTGQLETPDDLDRYITPFPEATFVKIVDVWIYAFAEYDDGTYGFWAGGRAGWFQLEEPIGSFKTIFNEMGLAVSILYFLADKLRHSRKIVYSSAEVAAAMKRTWQEFLNVTPYRDKLMDPDDVQASFVEHRHFIITSMLEDQEGLDWSRSPVYHWFKAHYPDDVQCAKDRLQSEAARVRETSKEAHGSHTKIGLSSDQRTERALRGCADASMINRPMKYVAETTPQNSNKRRRSMNSTSPESSPESGIERSQKSILRLSRGKRPVKSRAFTEELDPEQEAIDDIASEKARSICKSEIAGGTNRPALIVADRSRSTRQSASAFSDQMRSSRESQADFMRRKALELEIVRYDVPGLPSHGSDGLWKCPMPGCECRIHGASSDKGIDAARDHMRQHVTQAEEEVDLVLEESKFQLPVGHLVRQLKTHDANRPRPTPARTAVHRRY